MATSASARGALRKIPALRSLSGQELEAIRDKLVYRSYRSGEVLWRTRERIGFFGFIQSGEIDIEYRIDGLLVRSTRLCAGDPLPARNMQGRSAHATLLARAVTDVRLVFMPDAQMEKMEPLRQGQSERVARAARSRPAAKAASRTWLKGVWPFLLIMLVVGLARADIIRIASGLLYMASNHGGYYPPHDPRSMSLLKVAEQVDQGAAFAFNEEGYRWFQQERLPDAEAAFVQAVDRDPANAPALNNMAITYFTRGDLLQSAHYLQRAVEQEPDNATARYNLGIILMQQNDHAWAIREFREAGFIDPKAVSPHLQQAFLYIQIGDYVNAEQRARTAIQLDPSQSSAHLMLSIALYNQGRYTEALSSIADTLQLEPGDRVATFYQALILGRLGQYDVALPILEELLATSTDSQESTRISAEIEAIHRTLSELEAAAH